MTPLKVKFNVNGDANVSHLYQKCQRVEANTPSIRCLVACVILFSAQLQDSQAAHSEFELRVDEQHCS